MYVLNYSDFHKKTRGHLPPIDLKEIQQKSNATKIAVDMVIADQSLSADQVIDTLKKKGILQVYTSLQKFNMSQNIGSTNMSDFVNELNKQTKTETTKLQ